MMLKEEDEKLEKVPAGFKGKHTVEEIENIFEGHDTQELINMKEVLTLDALEDMYKTVFGEVPLNLGNRLVVISTLYNHFN